MFVSQQYKHLLLVSRQFNFLLKNGESKQSALARLSATLGKTHSKELGIIEQFISNDSNAITLPASTGPMSALSRLLVSVKKYGGDPQKFFEEFHKVFLSHENTQYIKNYDTSGIMVYLISLVLIASIIVSIYTIKVFPAINAFVSDSGASLPAFSQFIFTVFIDWAGVLALIIIALCSSFLYTALKIKNTVTNLQFFNSWILRLPGFESIAQQFNLYLCLRFLQLAHDSGVSGENAKTLIYDLINESNAKLDNQFSNIKSNQLDNILNEPLVFADSLGNLHEEIEYQVETLYEQSLTNFTRLKDAVSFIGIVIVASVIGSLILAMYQPIFMMGNVVGGQ